MASRVIHFELPADDPDRCAAFYQAAFGWTVQKWEGPTPYWMVGTGPDGELGIDGGIGPRGGPEDQVTNTIGVDDLDAAVVAVVAHGGTITRPRRPVPGIGWLAYCTDTEGNPFGVMQSDPEAS